MLFSARSMSLKKEPPLPYSQAMGAQAFRMNASIDRVRSRARIRSSSEASVIKVATDLPLRRAARARLSRAATSSKLGGQEPTDSHDIVTGASTPESA